MTIGIHMDVFPSISVSFFSFLIFCCTIVHESSCFVHTHTHIYFVYVNWTCHANWTKLYVLKLLKHHTHCAMWWWGGGTKLKRLVILKGWWVLLQYFSKFWCFENIFKSLFSVSPFSSVLSCALSLCVFHAVIFPLWCHVTLSLNFPILFLSLLSSLVCLFLPSPSLFPVSFEFTFCCPSLPLTPYMGMEVVTHPRGGNH